MTTPRLFWAERPRGMRCQGAGCGREPLCGFLSEDRKTFLCAACYTDGEGDQMLGGTRGVPRFRRPEERSNILRDY